MIVLPFWFTKEKKLISYSPARGDVKCFQKLNFLLRSYLVFLVSNRPLNHKQGVTICKASTDVQVTKNWLVSQILSRTFGVFNLLSVFVDTIEFGLELLLLRCYTKTQTKQIKLHVFSLISAHSFGEDSQRPIRERTEN